MNIRKRSGVTGMISRRRIIAGGSTGLLGLGLGATALGKSATISAHSAHLEDQLAIKRLLYRYALALDNLDAKDLNECFAADAVLQGGGVNLDRNVAEGLIARHQAARSPQQQFTLNIVLNHWYEVRKDAASGSAYWVETRVAGPKGKWIKTDTHLRYDDELVKQRGKWQFLRRHYQPLFVTESAVIDYATLVVELQSQ